MDDILDTDDELDPDTASIDVLGVDALAGGDDLVDSIDATGTANTTTLSQLSGATQTVPLDNSLPPLPPDQTASTTPNGSTLGNSITGFTNGLASSGILNDLSQLGITDALQQGLQKLFNQPAAADTSDTDTPNDTTTTSSGLDLEEDIGIAGIVFGLVTFL